MTKRRSTFRMLRVDMAAGRAILEDIPASLAGMGGRGLASGLLAHEMSPGCAALEPQSKLVFAPGLLGGVPPLAKNRLALGCKSPVTGSLQSSASSCQAAADLLRLGILGIVIENAAPPGLSLQLEIRRNSARLTPSPLAGLGIAAATAMQRRAYGPSCSGIMIGPAGESLLPTANIAFTLPGAVPPRHAGQGGIGAVMGSKGLKNIVIFSPDDEEPPVTEPDAYSKAAARLAAALAELSAKTRRITKQEGEKVPAQETEPACTSMGKEAPGKHCLHVCGLCGPSFAGRRAKQRQKSAAYTALWNSAAGDAKNLRARFDALCDDIGVDAFAVSAVAAACMEKGTIKAGDGAAVIAALERIGSGTLLDRVPGENPEGMPAGYAKGGTTQKAKQHITAGGSERHAAAFADAMGLCAFAAPSVLGSPEVRTALVRLLNARYGWALPQDYALSLGKHIVDLEKDFKARIVRATSLDAISP